jgi:hypothetical protein
MMKDIVSVMPETKNIAVVVGASPLEQYWLEQYWLEQYWLGEMRRLFEPFTSRVTLIYFNQLSFEDMLNKAQVLPEHSAIFFGLTSSITARGLSERTGLELLICTACFYLYC